MILERGWCATTRGCPPARGLRRADATVLGIRQTSHSCGWAGARAVLLGVRAVLLARPGRQSDGAGRSVVAAGRALRRHRAGAAVPRFTETNGRHSDH